MHALKGAEKRRAETREKIVQKAVDLFSKKGYYQTQVMDVVKGVGISAGTFYNYFKDKQDLFETVAQENLERLRLTLSAMRDESGSAQEDSDFKRFNLTYGVFFDYLDRYPKQFLMLMRGRFGVEKDIDLNGAWELFNRFAQDIAADIRKWIDQGVLEEGLDPYLISHMAVGMSIQVGLVYVVEKRFTREEAIKMLVETTEAVVFSWVRKQEIPPPHPKIPESPH